MTDELTKRLETIKREARHTFGAAHAEKWLHTPSRFFKGKTPLSFASEPEKADEVLRHVSYFGQAEI